MLCRLYNQPSYLYPPTTLIPSTNHHPILPSISQPTDHHPLLHDPTDPHLTEHLPAYPTYTPHCPAPLALLPPTTSTQRLGQAFADHLLDLLHHLPRLLLASAYQPAHLTYTPTAPPTSAVPPTLLHSVAFVRPSPTTY